MDSRGEGIQGVGHIQGVGGSQVEAEVHKYKLAKEWAGRAEQKEYRSVDNILDKDKGVPELRSGSQRFGSLRKS